MVFIICLQLNDPGRQVPGGDMSPRVGLMSAV